MQLLQSCSSIVLSILLFTQFFRTNNTNKIIAYNCNTFLVIWCYYSSIISIAKTFDTFLVLQYITPRIQCITTLYTFILLQFLYIILTKMKTLQYFASIVLLSHYYYVFCYIFTISDIFITLLS